MSVSFMNQAVLTTYGLLKYVYVFVYTFVSGKFFEISLLFLLEGTYWPILSMLTKHNFLHSEQMWDTLSIPVFETLMLISVILMVLVAESLWAGYQL